MCINTNKTVRFETVEIIECPITIGDNPSVSSGVPLTIEWDCQKRTKLALDFFEKHRPPRRTNKKLLRIKSKQRERLLRKIGFTLQEIDEATYEADYAREQRYETIREVEQEKQTATTTSKLATTKTKALDVEPTFATSQSPVQNKMVVIAASA